MIFFGEKKKLVHHHIADLSVHYESGEWFSLVRWERMGEMEEQSGSVFRNARSVDIISFMLSRSIKSVTRYVEWTTPSKFLVSYPVS